MSVLTVQKSSNVEISSNAGCSPAPAAFVAVNTVRKDVVKQYVFVDVIPNVTADRKTKLFQFFVS